MKHSKDAKQLHKDLVTLEAAGVDMETISMGGELEPILKDLSPGDVLTVPTLLDVCTGMYSLMELISRISEAGALLRSTNDRWFNMEQAPINWSEFASEMVALEKHMRSQRTITSLSRVAANGVKLGRPTGISPRI